MKHIVTVALVLNLGVADVYAQQKLSCELPAKGCPVTGALVEI
jgi:hypothetical protein